MTEKQKILIVDDKKANLMALRQVLADLDVEIIEATNGNQALSATLGHSFAVAILDVMMPGMDGYELAGYLRGDAKTRNLPIIFLTAVYSAEERIFKGYEVGAVDYIVKPYNPAVLLSKVRIFLELERARAQLAEKIVALSASEERYRSLVMTIPDIVYRIDTNGRFTYLNEAVQTLGYTQEELLGTHFSKILVPADMENSSRELTLSRCTGKSAGSEVMPELSDERQTGTRITSALEVLLVPRKGGRTVPAELHSGGLDAIFVEINSSGIYSGDPYGQKTILLGTVGVIRDITKRKQAEDEIRKARDELEIRVRERTAELAQTNRDLRESATKLDQLNKALRDFTLIAAHDLQEPLRKILTFGSLLTKKFQDGLGEEGKAHLFRMTGEATRMSALLGSLTEYFRIFSLARPFKVTDLTRVVEEVVRNFESTITSLGGEIEVNELAVIEADPDQMRLLFVNLIQNSLKYSRGYGTPRIKIHCEAGAETCRIVVQDNGIGFDRQYAEKIFTPFQRLHGRDSGYEGTGMGLAVCRKIVELHGGEIRAEAVPGEGATFAVTLPVKQSQGGMTV